MKASLLVAARNEEAHLPKLLASMERLHFPIGELEVLLGNDQSQDATGRIMDAWAAGKPWVRVVHISETWPGLSGKGNVLAQLGRQAQGEILMFTDADCILSQGWAQAMAGALQERPSAGIVTGTTVIYPAQSVFTGLQAVDWLTAQMAIYALSLVKVPVTGMGNNMAVTRQAYQAAGGYEAAGHSITEDLELFRNIRKAGYGYLHLYGKKALAYTAPQLAIKSWMDQRRRWFSGALQLPWATQIPFWGQLAFYPLLTLLYYLFGWHIALDVLVSKWICFGMFVGIALGLAGQLRLLWLYPLYEFWLPISGFWLVISYLRQPHISWKDRKYGRK